MMTMNFKLFLEHCGCEHLDKLDAKKQELMKSAKERVERNKKKRKEEKPQDEAE